MNAQTIRRWWDALKQGSAPVEIRIFKDGSTYSGYFTDVEQVIEQVAPFEGCNIYATVNPCLDACMSRIQGGKITKIGKNATTSGKDIEYREYILIDIDPDRPADTNATDAEKAKAHEVAGAVYRYLKNEGFADPIIADSGNGYHLYYRIKLDNSDSSTGLVKTFLKVLDNYFSLPEAHIDTQVSDPNRIAKVIGTISAKGRNTKDRPQRESKLLYVPDNIMQTDVQFIQKVASELPDAPKPTRENNYSREPFDVEAFIQAHGIQVVKRVQGRDCEKIILKECPFDCNHQQAAIFKYNNGATAFKCFHNSCSSYKWKDVRLHFDPTAYDRKDRESYENRHRYDRPKRQPVIQPQTDETGAKWLKPSDIKFTDLSKFPFVPTGVIDIDRAMLGLTLGDVTIISGLAGSGKTSLLDYIILNAVNKGFKAAAWSGELQDFRFMGWLDQMAAGRTLVHQVAGYENIYYAPKLVAEKINGWLDGKFYLYNNNYGNHWSQLFNDIEVIVEQTRPELILIDNLTALNLDKEYDKFDNQKTFINDVKDFAKSKNVHIVLVCHPRKEQSFHLLRMESISGSSDLFNLCDNVFIVHRGGRDLVKRMTEFFGNDKAEAYANFDAVIEIAKNRSHGAVGKLIGLYFEKETRRFVNYIGENIVYGWNECVPQIIQWDKDLDEDLPY